MFIFPHKVTRGIDFQGLKLLYTCHIFRVNRLIWLCFVELESFQILISSNGCHFHAHWTTYPIVLPVLLCFPLSL